MKRVIAHIECTGDANAFYRIATLRFGTPMQSSGENPDVKPLNTTEVRINLPSPPA